MSHIAGTAANEYEISSDDGNALQADRYIQGIESTVDPTAMNLTTIRRHKYL